MFKLKEIIERDYQAGLDFIDKIDGQLFRIRHWTILSVTAVLAYSHHEDIPEFSLFGVFISIFFLLLELIYKSFQDDIIEMTRNIDENIQKELNSNSDEKNWGDYTVGMGRYLKRPSIIRIIKSTIHKDKWHIVIIYLFAIISSIASYFYLS